MDTTKLSLTCHFPYKQLAAFQSLESLALDFCRPTPVMPALVLSRTRCLYPMQQ